MPSQECPAPDMLNDVLAVEPKMIVQHERKEKIAPKAICQSLGRAESEPTSLC